MNGLAAQIPSSWRDALAAETQKPYFRALESFVAAERSAAHVFPAEALTFAALARTPPDAVKVVVVGQDPYPTAGNANGLAFSVNPGQRVPASLKNIFKLLGVDVGTVPPAHGDLTQWADQGVLLLNTVLTVREGAPNSHRNQGWEDFTTATFAAVNQGPRPVVFLLLGAKAQKLAPMVDVQKHAVVTAAHPSPMSATKFLQSRPFSAVNAALVERGQPPVDWQLR